MSETMSIDWTVYCDSCRKGVHLGQRFTGMTKNFGFGANDEKGRDSAAEFIDEHLGHDLRIAASGSEPDGVEDVTDYDGDRDRFRE